jgi:alpha-tubulin suppressor-like RCC1 family protein
VLLTSGALACVGSGAALGDGTGFDRATFVAPTGIADAAQVTAGTGHTCARRRSGEILCWGDNGLGQVGDGTTVNRLAPVVVLAP